MIKLSDYLAQFFVDRGVCDCFLVSGGGIMHLLDAVGRNRGMRYYCNYHEQACAIAAEGYARVTRRPGLCFGTTGPGAINALSGMTSAWVDSVPLILVAGQVRTDVMADYTHVRQVGPQEGNVVAMAKPVTKYAVTVKDPRRIRYELERAWHAAVSGRPGPVVIEVPLDVQGALIDETVLDAFDPPPASPDRSDAAHAADAVLDEIGRAQRPLFVAGNGVHSAGARELLYDVLERVGIPVVLPLTAKDLVHETHPLQMGVFGPSGQRRANFAVQNCDLLIGLASGLNLQKAGFNIAGFAPRARKIFVDVDRGQLTHQAFKPDVALHAEIFEFLEAFLARAGRGSGRREPWLDACRNWKQQYPILTGDYFADSEHVNTYAFMDALAAALAPQDLVTTGNGTEVASFYQAFQVKRGQRAFNIGWGAMGWDLPVAIGACIGSARRRTICATGDGSIQWNIQELLTIAHYRLPIKIFVVNNGGYTCIRSTQNNFFQGRFVGADPASGVANVNFEKLAAAYGIDFSRIRNNAGLAAGIAEALAHDGPSICELNVSPAQGISPRVSSFRREDGTFESRPIEDMAPFLPREEIYANMRLFDAPQAEADAGEELEPAGSAVRP